MATYSVGSFADDAKVTDKDDPKAYDYTSSTTVRNFMREKEMHMWGCQETLNLAKMILVNGFAVISGGSVRF